MENPTPSDNDNSDELSFGPSDESLQAELKAYKQALEQEFATSGETLEDPTSNAEAYTRKFFRKNLPDAAAQIVWLANNADSDSVRLRACQTIVKEALEDARAEGDPIKDLLRELANS